MTHSVYDEIAQLLWQLNNFDATKNVKQLDADVSFDFLDSGTGEVALVKVRHFKGHTQQISELTEYLSYEEMQIALKAALAVLSWY